MWRLLRSRTLAIWAIIAFVAYAAAATVLAKDGDFAAPYGSPVFIALAGLLATSTATCAWERSRAAVRALGPRRPSESALRQLRERPPLVIGAGGEESLGTVEAALKGLGMRVARDDAALEARAGVAGSLGSAVFHWSLALLFVVVGLGQLTRAEGLMGVVEGTARPDVAESYGALDTGRLKTKLSGRLIAVPVIEPSFVANGIEQGMTPLVEIRSAEGDVLASGHAYPNHPIRYRSMLVHSADYGLAVVASIEQEGQSISKEVLLDYVPDHSAVEPGGFSIADSSGAVLMNVAFDLPPEDVSEAREVRVSITGGSPAGAGSTVQHVVPEGGSLDLGDGLVLRIGRLTGYARLSVVDDWSVYYIYALFGVAMLGLMLAIFMPSRAVRVLELKAANEYTLHVAVRHGRGDPHFPGRVERALRRAVES